MFPFLFAVTDVSGTVALIEGLNDNVVQTQDSPTQVTRHAALFTGLETGVTLRLTEPNQDVHGLRLRLRTQFYEPLDNYPESPDGTMSASYASIVSLGKHTGFLISASSSLSRVTSARVSDGTLLFQIDPSSTATTFTVSQATMAITQELTKRWKFRQSVGVLLTTTVQAPPFQLADGLELDRRGIDGVQPETTSSLIHEFGPRDTGDVSLTYRYLYSPYTLDYTTNPPHAGGPQRIQQVVPDIGLTHLLSPQLSSLTRVGISIATPPVIDESKKLVILPVATEDLRYTSDRWGFNAQAGFTYGSVTPRLGAGPSLNAQGTLYGVPWTNGRLKRLMVLASVAGNHSQLQSGVATTGAQASNTYINVVGASLEARYALSRTVGILGGYDARYSTIGSTNGPTTPFVRQIFFIGVSGYWSTDQVQLPPLEQLNAPFRPG
ncbi:MAG: hypothetical protein ABIP89_14410 [Polyangiaceae bacterium]